MKKYLNKLFIKMDRKIRCLLNRRLITLKLLQATQTARHYNLGKLTRAMKRSRAGRKAIGTYYVQKWYLTLLTDQFDEIDDICWRDGAVKVKIE